MSVPTDVPPADAPASTKPRWLTPEMERLMEVVIAWPDNPTVGEAMKRLTELLPSEDDEPMETPIHYFNIALLVDVIDVFRSGRDDYFAGGNMFLYYSFEQIYTEKIKGPDFFLVEGVDRKVPREKWVVWMEKKFPDVIVEFTSPSTARYDRTTKKDIYEQEFRTPEYYCYDPKTTKLAGWHLHDGVYQGLTANERGWLWSPRLQLWLGPWDGVFKGFRGHWLRLYQADGQLAPLEAEAEKQRADDEKQRAEAEKQRADAAEAETARLRARLAELERSEHRADS